MGLMLLFKPVNMHNVLMYKNMPLTVYIVAESIASSKTT